jgi:hypothetical protein
MAFSGHLQTSASGTYMALVSTSYAAHMYNLTCLKGENRRSPPKPFLPFIHSFNNPYGTMPVFDSRIC